MLPERIIFLREDRYSKFDHRRLGIDILKRRGFAVEFWDCSKIFRPQFQSDQQASDVNKFSGLKYFEKKSYLLENIVGLTSRDTLVITGNYLSLIAWDVLKHIADTKALWGTIRLGAIPVAQEESHFRSRLERFIRRPSLAINFLLQKLLSARLGFRPFDFVMVGGNAPLFGIAARMGGPNTKILDTHSFDYERHLQELNDREKVVCSEEIVYLDDGGPFHRDRRIFNTQFPCPMEEYFSNLNSFFRMIEQQFGCSVVIAGHPRVNYEKQGNPFDGRKIVKGESSLKWIKHSKFVVSSCSTSVNFAVIYKKPVVFLSISATKKNHYDTKTKGIAAKLGKSPIYPSSSEDIDWNQELTFNKNYYDQYTEAYIKKQGSPEKSCWDILADYLSPMTC